MQGWEKRANIGRIDLLLIFDYATEKLRNGGVAPKVFFDSLPEIERDGREHRLSDKREIVAIKAAYREKI